MSLTPFSNYINSLSKQEKKALRAYTESCTLSNTLIRKGRKLVGENKGYYTNILDIFAKGPKVTKALTVYRGVDVSNVHECKKNSGFISTSLIKSTLEAFVGDSCCSFKVTLPPGDYSVLPLWDVSAYPGEDELLLPPGTIQVTGEISPGYYSAVYLPDSSVIVFDTKSGDTGKEFTSNEEWVKRIRGDISEKMIQEASEEYYKHNTIDPYIDEDEVNERWRESFMISTVSDLEYWNDIPEDALYMYLSSVELLPKQTKRYLMGNRI